MPEKRNKHSRHHASPWADRWPVLRFLLLFAVAMAAFQLLFFALIVESAPFELYLRALAWTTGTLLDWMGNDVTLDGSELTVSGAVVAVAAPCSGLQPMAMFAISVLAFPSSLRAKGLGLGVGVSLLLAVNQVRVIVLSLVVLLAPDSFELLHIYVWPMIFILISIGMWFLWARRALVP